MSGFIGSETLKTPVDRLGKHSREGVGGIWPVSVPPTQGEGTNIVACRSSGRNNPDWALTRFLRVRLLRPHVSATHARVNPS